MIIVDILLRHSRDRFGYHTSTAPQYLEPQHCLGRLEFEHIFHQRQSKTKLVSNTKTSCTEISSNVSDPSAQFLPRHAG